MVIKGFKPYYKWNTFNTQDEFFHHQALVYSFKPYYKWNTFNTRRGAQYMSNTYNVLNLIINGIPSILPIISYSFPSSLCFKPYYKWNTFNTYQKRI